MNKVMYVLVLGVFLISCSEQKFKFTFGDAQTITGKLAGFGQSSSLATAGVTCNSPIVELYKLNSNGEKIQPALGTSSISADGQYSFGVRSLGLNFKKSLPAEALMVVVSGCESGVYSRPITSAKDQNITTGSSLVTYILGTAKKNTLSAVLVNQPAKVEALLKSLENTQSFSNAYNALINDENANDQFQELFGAAPDVLPSAAPVVVDFSVPDSAQEQMFVNLSARIFHWSAGYVPVYEWKIDNRVLSQQADYSFKTAGNDQGGHTITLTIGQDNGSGQIDSSKPTKVVTHSLQISNDILPTPPSFSVTQPVVLGTQPINSRSVTVTLNTGVDKINCDSFESLVLTEGTSAKPAASSFNISCNQANSQDMGFVVTSPGDGTKTLRLWALDSSGVISTTPTEFSFNLDTGVPSVTISTTPLAMSNSGSQIFSFSGFDNGGYIDRFECRMDAGSWDSCSSPQSYSSLTEGDHTFSLRAVDTAGNVSPVVSKTWHIDLTPPVLTLTGTPNAITNSLAATFSFSATDSGGSGFANYFCQLDSAVNFTQCTAIQMYTLAIGNHSLKVRATDVAGNVSATQNFSWIIDITPPTATITSKPTSLNNSPSATFSFSGTDAGGAGVASFECQLDGQGFAACASPKSYASLSSGAHTFAVRAIDAAGNVGTTSASYSWTIDLTTPLASINSGPDSITNNTTATYTFSANPPPSGSIIGYECQLDGLGWNSCSSPKSYSGLVQGDHTFEVRSIDNNSQYSAPTSQEWAIDTTDPVITLGTVPASLNNSTSSSISFSSTDSGGGVVAGHKCKLDGGSYAPCSSPANLSGLSQGVHTYSITATDSAGNTSAPVSTTWTVDLTAPVLTLSSMPASITNTTTASFSFGATDSGGGVVSSYSCSLDSSAYSSCSSPASYSGLAEGAHTFAVMVSDSAGNSSVATTYSWTVDLTAPTLNITSKPNSISNLTSASFTFSGNDTGGGSVANYSCKLDAGSYAACTSPQTYSSLAEGSHTFSVKATDTAGNVSTVQSYTWTLDVTSPAVTIATPSSNGTVVQATSLSSYPVSGSCSENGISVVISGAASLSVPCSGGAWSTTINIAALSDGTLSLVATQTDPAGNSTSTAARTFIKDTVAPVIFVTTPLALPGNSGNGSVTWSLTDANIAASTNFSVELFDGASWTSVGTLAATTGANSSKSYTLNSFVVPNVEVTTAKIRVSVTDAAGNATTSSSGTFLIDSTPPTVTSLTINGGAANASSNSVAVSLGATGNTGVAKITHFCLSYGGNTTPAANDPCWVSLSRSDVNVTPSTNISVSNFYFTLGLSPITFTVYAWVKDEAQQISAANSANITLKPGTPPAVNNITVANRNNPTLPLASADTSFPLNSDVYIYWNVTDVEGLAVNPVKLEYSTDDTNWTVIATGLSETAQSGCSLIGISNGCYKWSAGAPTDNGIGTPGITADDKAFKVRVTAVDAGGMISSSTSVNVNAGNLFLIGGNTNQGYNGSAMSATLYASTGISNPANANFVMTSKGELFYLDPVYGISYVSPNDGVLRQLIPVGAIGTENGSIANTKVVAPFKIAIDYQDYVYIYDNDRIRKIDTKANPMTISTIVGGGSNDDMTTKVGTAFKLTAAGYGSVLVVSSFQVLGNGDIWFGSESSASQATYRRRIRLYNHVDGKVYSYNINGMGNGKTGTLDLTAASTAIYRWVMEYDINTFAINKFIASTAGTLNNCGDCGLSVIDLNTWTSQGPHPSTGTPYNDQRNPLYAGLDGKIYSIGQDLANIKKYNSSTNTFSNIYGSGVLGYCPSGTLATSCNSNISGVFVSKQGRVFVQDNNLIRTIDDDGKVQTIFGQSLSFGESTLATNARFREVSSLGTWYDTVNSLTKVIALDRFGYKIREFPVGGSINTIAGNGLSNGLPSKGVDATTIPLNTEGSNGSANNLNLLVDPANGTVYKGVGYSGNYMLQRGASNVWVDMINLGAGPYVNFDSDSLIANPVPANTVTWGNYSYTLFHGISANSILMIDHDYDSPMLQHRGGALMEYDRTNGTLEKIGGMYGQPNVAFTICPDGTLATSCLSFYSLETSGSTGYTRASYDAYLDSWIMAVYGTKNVRVLKKRTNLSTLVTVSQPIRSMAYLRVGGAAPTKHKIWYCTTSGALREYDLLTSTDVALSWKISNMTCTSNYMSYSAERNSLIFPIQQNNLGGVAEYLLP